ncbi:hypothetical protein [Actinocorallia libanotica]|uniref:Uncharacterized protein n=1 Tax=Actinocorallia libanotica TaxID=46162 RepID=A0ABP4C5D6_9ACTN
MNARLSVADISGYLASRGWTRRPEEWRGASIWVHEGDHEILVPGSDGFSDGPRRVREILAVLARVEERSPEDVAAEIASPMADVHWYRSATAPQDGQVGLADTVTALGGVQSVLGAAARAALNGPRPAFDGTTPREVRDLLARVRVGPITASADRLMVRLPLGSPDDPGGPGTDPPLARRTLLLLRRTTMLLRDAADTAGRGGDMAVFDDLVRDGVSADLCGALARFAGPDPGSGFEVGFGWARALPADVPETTVAFEAETGALLRRAAHRLRRLRRATASVSGLISTLSDHGGRDRFSVQVHGDVTVEGGEPRKSLWVRLPDESAYDLAVEAHRTRRHVHASGTLMDLQGRVELNATDFTTLTADAPRET